jgi:hypothetical protein
MKRIQATWGGVAALVVAIGLSYPVAAWATDESDPSDRAAEKKSVDLTEIRERGQRMPIDRRIDIDKRIRATVGRVNKQAADKGQAAVAARLASKFSLTTEALIDEKGRHGFSWGEMVIAGTLLSNSQKGVTLSDLATLRAEGLGWGAIAFGLGFHVEDLEDTIKSAGRVAMGLSKADGAAPATGKLR